MMLHLVINLQRRVKIDTKPLRYFAAELLANVSEAGGRAFSVALVSNERMIDLNRLFRNKEGTTDVLSFPNQPEDFESALKENLGDIVISVEQANLQATE